MEVVLPEKVRCIAPNPARNHKILFSASVFPFRPHSSLICAGDYRPILQIRKAGYQKKPTCFAFGWQRLGLAQTWALKAGRGLVSPPAS